MKAYAFMFRNFQTTIDEKTVRLFDGKILSDPQLSDNIHPMGMKYARSKWQCERKKGREPTPECRIPISTCTGQTEYGPAGGVGAEDRRQEVAEEDAAKGEGWTLRWGGGVLGVGRCWWAGWDFLGCDHI